MRVIALLYFLFVIMPLHCIAQDIHFSNWKESAIISAPANTGNFDGNLKIMGNFRNQWRSVTTPYKTAGISAEAKDFIGSLPRLQMGLGFSRDITGDSRWVTTQAQCIVAYEIGLGLNFSITPLIGTGLIQQQYSNENLQYDQQWNGTYYDPSLQSGESFTQFNNNYYQFTHGLSAGIKNDETATLLGYSMQLNTSNENAAGYGIQRSARTTIIAVHRRKADEFVIEPTIHFQFQKSYRNILPGIKLYKSIETGNWHNVVAHAGVSIRISDAIIPTLGMQYDQWTGGISYDVNLSKLKVASNGRGSWEIYIGTVLKKIPRVIPTPYCRPIY